MVYGVVLKGDAVDAAATRTRREALRRERLQTAIPVAVTA